MKIERGILQGDSLSFILFVPCMDSLNRKLNLKYSKIGIQTGDITFGTNHLLFTDDLKLLAIDEIVLKAMVEETKKFFTTFGLEVNVSNSATSCKECNVDAMVLKGCQGYKYLCITEDSTSSSKQGIFEKVRTKILARVERICRNKLNVKNVIRAVNKHAIYVINYQVELMKLEASKFNGPCHDIRQVLINHHVHLQPACIERLYLPSSEIGRGLINVEHRSGYMLLNMYQFFLEARNGSLIEAAIFKVEENDGSHLILIEKVPQNQV